MELMQLLIVTVFKRCKGRMVHEIWACSAFNWERGVTFPELIAGEVVKLSSLSPHLRIFLLVDVFVLLNELWMRLGR